MRSFFHKESPNQSSRHGEEAEACVIHYTASPTASSAIRWFEMPESNASAHFVIARDGTITQMVPLERAAWHAGRGEMLDLDGEMRGYLNRRTIGIELANLGLLIPGDEKEDEGDREFFYAVGGGRKIYKYKGPEPQHAQLRFDSGLHIKGYWEPFDDRQIEALRLLLERIGSYGYEEAAGNLVGHEDVALPQGRKTDPGPLFPWRKFPRDLTRSRTYVSALRSYPNP